MTTITRINDYTEHCFHRLPCGLCTMTNRPCPMMPDKCEITWATTTATTGETTTVYPYGRCEKDETD